MSTKIKSSDSKPIRQAGESLRVQMDAVFVEGVFPDFLQGVYVVAVLMGGWFVVLIPGYSIWTMWFLTVVGFGYLIYLAFRMRKRFKYYKCLKKGMLGERLVEEQLDQIRKAGFDVFHDFILKDERGTENIDHIIVGLSGIFTMETKNWSAKGVPQDDRITFDGETLKIGTFPQEDKVLKQPRRQAAKLQSILQPVTQDPLWVVPILCFWDRYVQLTRFNPTGLQVLNQKGIASFILSREQKLSPETVRKISLKLRELNRAD